MTKVQKRVIPFVSVGVGLTLLDYAIYESLVLTFLKDGNFAIASAISGAIAMIVGFVLHSKITWKDRAVSKFNIVKFFAWNIAVSMALRPFLIQLVNSLAPINNFWYGVLQWSGLSYNSIVSTWVYGVVAVITMTLNFIFYDRFVFGKDKEE